jgi:hypothetical protein
MVKLSQRIAALRGLRQISIHGQLNQSFLKHVGQRRLPAALQGVALFQDTSVLPS